MKHENETIEKQSIVLDGNEYIGCTFRDCQLIYSGGAIPSLTHCRFERCQWAFQDAADRTIIFLKALRSGGFRELVEEIIQDIRTTPRSPKD